jgi:hypothetical protein
MIAFCSAIFPLFPTSSLCMHILLLPIIAPMPTSLVSSSLLCSSFFLFSAFFFLLLWQYWDRVQSLMLARQAHYYLTHSASSFLLLLFLT